MHIKPVCLCVITTTKKILKLVCITLSYFNHVYVV